MTLSEDVYRIRFGVFYFAVSGVLFILYPAIRPFSDEVSLEGAAAFASGAWILSHVLAMIAFTLLILGLLSLQIHLKNSPAECLMFKALIVSWLGIGLILPFYGAETFGLHAVGLEAVHQQNILLVALANDIRMGPGLPIFITGLLLLAIGSIMTAFAVWKSGTLQRWSGVPFALGFILYMPQFAASQPLRIAHGVLVASGCIWIASSMIKNSKNNET